jgi:hypothetical protein
MKSHGILWKSTKIDENHLGSTPGTQDEQPIRPGCHSGATLEGMGGGSPHSTPSLEINIFKMRALVQTGINI